MKSTIMMSISITSLLASLAMPVRLAAQEPAATQKPAAIRYTVTDLGTLPGGNFSQPFFINRYGLVSGSASLPDGTQHAVLWLEGLMGDIGAPGHSADRTALRLATT